MAESGQQKPVASAENDSESNGPASWNGDGTAPGQNGIGGNGHGPVPVDVSSESLAYLESVYETYIKSPGSVDEKWRTYFENMRLADDSATTNDVTVRPESKRRSVFNPPTVGEGGLRRPQRIEVAGLQERLDQLIRNYRVRGHILAEIDPLGSKRGNPPELRPEFYGFTEKDFDRRFSTAWFGGPEVRTLRAMMQWLRTTYCRSIAVQFMHIDSLRVREWLQTRMETTGNRLRLNREEQIRILEKLNEAVLFEEFVQKKFLGQKSFSLEGAESLIPLLDLAIEQAAEDGAKEIVFGMAHRGRLNVLANVLSKSPREIFREFVDKDPELHMGRGDVKYHMGYSNDWTTANGRKVHLSLCFNPSHLEFINTVAQGRMRAKMDHYQDWDHKDGLVILIHGDAAFAGEGNVQETLNLSELPGYSTGGTLHIVVNNQIGFTTSASDARSCTYPTDVAKMLQIPIFHVNGEDPEAVAQVIRLALEFRKKFHRDVVIDMWCYRRHGHNESDEPEFTQPMMYKKIKKRQTIYDAYLNQMLSMKGVTQEEADKIVSDRRQVLEEEFEAAQDENYIRCVHTKAGIWSEYHGGAVEEADEPNTWLTEPEARRILTQLTKLPEGFTPHKRIERILANRKDMADGKRSFDWGAGELLAFASLLECGHPLRMTGQDVERGTFSHRHAVLTDCKNGKPHLTLEQFASEKGFVEIYNSPLSESGVLGFEYGYSLDCPEGLVVWEAQFGDFCNAAQVIIDQFITSAEDKWQRLSSLVMLLPHGFEGQGPEHSSARLERFLMLAAEDNIQIVNPTTPAQYFHCLRRHVLQRWKKPLIVMTPKSLLRLPEAVSPLEEFTTGQFEPVMADVGVREKSKVKRVLLCSGKLYYELAKRRKDQSLDQVAILRLEELYPLPTEQLRQLLSEYNPGTPIWFIQEEPENMGASRYLRINIGNKLFDRHAFRTIERPESASPATGSGRAHAIEQKRLIDQAFADI